MKKDVQYLTEEGYNKLIKELTVLRNVERPEHCKRIEDTRSFGDSSENDEYNDAIKSLEMLDIKIHKIEQTISNSKVVTKNNIDTSKVSILSTVVVKNLSTNKILEYTIVPENEINIKQNKISFVSPIAKGLLSKNIGDVVEITIPVGKMKLEILEIKF